MIHVDVWQKPIQHREGIILQLKINFFLFLFKGGVCLSGLNLPLRVCEDRREWRWGEKGGLQKQPS